MRRNIVQLILIIVVLVGFYNIYRPLPDDVSFQGDVHTIPASDVTFFSDLTYLGESGDMVHEHTIFDEVFRMIENAESYILIDMFLFNDFTTTDDAFYRDLAGELTAALIAKKESYPEITIQFITDPINTFYGGTQSELITKLEGAGVEVIITDLSKLRDSNPLYSALWRTGLQWFHTDSGGGTLPNPLHTDGQKVTLMSYLKSLNFKANHRKVIITDAPQDDGSRGMSVLITSANPHSASSKHSNSAIRIDSALWQDAVQSENAIIEFSGGVAQSFPDIPESIDTNEPTIGVQLLTERRIRDAVLKSINALEVGDTIDMAMFYIADRKIVRALKAADERGVSIRLLFDANKDAFGREKNGLPNRQVASELIQNSNGNTEVRWCKTHGEQCHSKLVLLESDSGFEMIIGSANFTRRNLGDYNLETNVRVVSVEKIGAIQDAYDFFETYWTDKFSLPYETFRDDSIIKKILYRLSERSGMSRW